MRTKIWGLLTLMVIGEGAFLLPFVVSRIFRPTFLKVFDLTNFELGSAFSVYGVVATLSYLFGGPIADRFSPKKLLIFSLLSTMMAAIPSLTGLTLLYGFWGISTILLFWAAFTKETRVLGGDESQGLAYGLVDGGRGLLAAMLASASVLLFATYLPLDPVSSTVAELTNSLQIVIYFFCGLIALSAFMVWIVLPGDGAKATSHSVVKITDLKQLATNKVIWLQGVILLCAYVGYKCTDDFSLYASDALGFNDVHAAHVGTIPSGLAR